MSTTASVTKRGKTWQVRWREAGRHRSRTVPGPRRNALKVARDIEQRLALGPLYEAPPETLGAFLAAYLERYRLRVKDNTFERRKGALESLVLPRHDYLQSLTVADVEDAVAALARRAPRQAQMALEGLKSALRSAGQRGQRFDRAILEIAKPRHEAKSVEVLTWEQVEELASWCPDFIKRIVLVAALTGARQGELFDLYEEHLDLDKGIMRIVAGKTAASSRSVHLPALAVSLFREQMLVRAKHTALVFPTLKGHRWQKNNFGAYVFRPAREKCGLHDFPFHGLRHTYVSLMASAGADPATIASQIGHVDGGALLLRNYRHLFPREAENAVSRLNALVRKTGWKKAQ